MSDLPRFLLLQVREPGDPVRDHEIASFCRSLGVDGDCIVPFDLLSGAPSQPELDEVDVVLIGGSGDHSVVQGGPWLPDALETMVTLYETDKPTFASCWGFQALSKALGGEVITDRSRAEVGTVWLDLTETGRDDPVFGPVGPRFQAQIGHKDIVTVLPDGAELLASSETVENQAFRIPGKPIYATQFHPEMNREDLIARLARYPEYLPLVGFDSVDELVAVTPETPEAESLMGRFLEEVLGL